MKNQKVTMNVYTFVLPKQEVIFYKIIDYLLEGEKEEIQVIP